eukprot:CAMPEP_0119048806 /NCGR_PEP_ID=MMETSP1177-20130426/61104_1 /TAXON_ID=2985 /ORGANISM="Ochromonas sp, Strain CCMP1899" /LENGTH=262 /DNA_ID=CAMNT_0007025197 /DNA_START=269 /DNA_END=1057 /DNA_ORIENTATION=-
MVDTEVRTWRPVGDTGSQMREHFLGTAARLKDPTFVNGSKGDPSVINRFGMLTESSGSIRVRFNIIKTDPRTAVVREKEPLENKSINRRRTVEDILQAFKATGGIRRSLNATGGVGGHGSSPLSSSRKMLTSNSMNASEFQSLKGTGDKKDRVDEIIARAKTLTKRLDSRVSTDGNVRVSTDINNPEIKKQEFSNNNPMYNNDKKSSVSTDGVRATLSSSGPLKARPRGGKHLRPKSHRYEGSDGIQEEDEADLLLQQDGDN